jgi:hypothetical protein
METLIKNRLRARIAGVNTSADFQNSIMEALIKRATSADFQFLISNS